MDKITTTFIRLLKESDIFGKIKMNDDIKVLINTINYKGFFTHINYMGYINEANYWLYNFKKIFNIDLCKSFFNIQKTIVIYEIKDFNRFKDFVNNNGIIWCTHRSFTNDDVIRFRERQKTTNVYFAIDLNENCALRHGSYHYHDEIYRYDERLNLKEEEFYEYFLKLREEFSKRLDWFIIK